MVWPQLLPRVIYVYINTCIPKKNDKPRKMVSPKGDELKNEKFATKR